MKARIAFVMILTAISTMTAIPRTIQYQGKITDNYGIGVNDTMDIEFRFYDVEIGGTSFWSETVTDVLIIRGLFNAAIESVDLPFDEQYWMEIVADGDVMSPRVKLTSSAYAFRAEIADSIAGGDQIIGTRDTMIAHWDSIRGIPDLDDGDWSRSDGKIYSFNTSDSVIIGAMTAYDKLDVSGSMTVRGDNGNIPHGIGLSSNEEHIRLSGNHSDYIIAVQDGSGRIQHYWNSTTASIENLYLVDDERAWMWDISVATNPYMEFKYAPQGIAGDPITWTTHMAFDTLGNVDVLGDITANAFIGDGSGLTGISSGLWAVSGDDMYSSVSGNVGVGLDSPDSKLQVCGNFEVVTGSYYMYVDVGENSLRPTPRCPCDVDGNTVDCPDTFYSETDLGATLYDWYFWGFGYGSHVYERTAVINPTILSVDTTSGSVDIDADVDITGDINIVGMASISGRVGIGTSAPGGKVEISSNSTSTTPTLLLHETDADAARIRFMNDDTTTYYTISAKPDDTPQSSNMTTYFYTTPIITFQGDGKVGIGTTSPSELLDVSGKTKTTNFAMTNGASNGYLLKSDASGNASWIDPSTINDNDWVVSELNMYSCPPGCVGIGSSAPMAKLEVKHWSSSEIPQLLLNEGSSNYARLYFKNADTTAFWAISALPADDPAYARMNFFYIADRVTVRGDGKVGIGTSAPSTKLDVAGSVRADAYIEYSTDYVGDAISILKAVQTGAGNGDWRPVDHMSWPLDIIREYSYDANTEDVYLPDGAEYLKKEDGSTVVYGRSLNGLLSIDTRAIQQLIEKTDSLEKENAELRERIEQLERTVNGGK